MVASVKRNDGWQRRKARVRKKVRGSAERLRLNVYRSNRHIYAQLVEDTDGGRTVVAASTLSKAIRDDVLKLGKTDAARKVGEHIGVLAREKGIAKVTFDRSGYLYHGRVKALADGARAAGLNF
ncbi:MAG: 50S ribosomal protein L18 [Deltaproteobacteria bacterium]|nr:50S ribosomal protein L18 [Deltaproteobacteria bacterium]